MANYTVIFSIESRTNTGNFHEDRKNAHKINSHRQIQADSRAEAANFLAREIASQLHTEVTRPATDFNAEAGTTTEQAYIEKITGNLETRVYFEVRGEDEGYYGI